MAIALNLEAEKAINYYHQYFMLLGITEFTKAYLQVKDNPWPFVDLVKLIQNSRMKDSELVELLRIANRYLPRVRLECDRLKEKKSSLEAELNNNALTYQQFVDRNVELKKREDELLQTINELENEESEFQKTVTGLKQRVSELRENGATNTILDLEVKQEDIISTNDVLVSPSNIANNYHHNENELHAQVKSSSRTLIFDTKDLF